MEFVPSAFAGGTCDKLLDSLSPYFNNLQLFENKMPECDDGLNPPIDSNLDLFHSLTEAAISQVPVLGAAASVIFGHYIAKPVESRQIQWMNLVAEALRKLLAEKKLRIEDVVQSEIFVDAVLQASAAAVKTSHEEKLEALKNAVLNSALPANNEESWQRIFINLIDELSFWQIRILKLYSDPKVWFLENKIAPPQFCISSSISSVIEKAFPELASDESLMRLEYEDLEYRKLLSGSLHGMMSSDGAMAGRLTIVGQRFLRFVSPPRI